MKDAVLIDIFGYFFELFGGENFNKLHLQIK